LFDVIYYRSANYQSWKRGNNRARFRSLWSFGHQLS